MIAIAEKERLSTFRMMSKSFKISNPVNTKPTKKRMTQVLTKIPYENESTFLIPVSMFFFAFAIEFN